MEEVLNHIIRETKLLKDSNLKLGSVEDLIKLWAQFCRCYGIFKLEEYKFNNPPHKLVSKIINPLLSILDLFITTYYN